MGPPHAAVPTRQDRGSRWKLQSTITAYHDLDEAKATRFPNGRRILMVRLEGESALVVGSGPTWTKPVTFGMRLFAPNLDNRRA